jgi:hypothetical protein
MESKLLTRPGRQCPSCASGGRFQRRKSTTCMVVIQLPPGWMMVIWISALVVVVTGDVVIRRVHEAAVLIRVISLRLGGLAQPDISPLT